MAYTETPAAYLDAFGESVTVGGQALRAIVDMDYVVQGGAVVGLSGRTIALTMPQAGLPSQLVGKAAAVRAVNYQVAEAKPDATGWTVLFLERA